MVDDGWTEGERQDLLRHLGDIVGVLRDMATEQGRVAEALEYLGHAQFQALCLAHANAVVAADESEKREPKAELTFEEKVDRLRAVALRKLLPPPWDRKEEADGEGSGSEAGPGAEA